jgi:hypothetical protein
MINHNPIYIYYHPEEITNSDKIKPNKSNHYRGENFSYEKPHFINKNRKNSTPKNILK